MTIAVHGTLPLTRRLDAHTPIPLSDRCILDGLSLETRTLPGARGLAWTGEAVERLHVVLSGWCCSYRFVTNGERRIVAFHLPGEIPDIHALDLSTRDMCLSTVGPCVVAVLPLAEARALRSASPTLAEALRREAAILGSLLAVRAGQSSRPVEGRLAHSLCETLGRLSSIAACSDDRIRLPFGRDGLHEAVGASIEDTLRAVSSIEARGLAAWNRRDVSIRDASALAELGDYDPVHLHLRPRAPAARPRPVAALVAGPALRLIAGGLQPG